MRSRNESIFVLTGAGVSADSGLPTFRGAHGLWEGRRLEDVATPEAWERDPATVWRFYQARRAALREARPNDGHRALARLEESCRRSGAGFLLVTQNVDDLHEKAGSRPLHMHGELARMRCESCGFTERDLDRIDPEAFLPCGWCARPRLRPDVVWFGEMPYSMEEIGRALTTCTLFLASGTSGLVTPAAGLLAEARAVGARTWVNSLDPPENLDPADRFAPGRSAEVLPRLVSEIEGLLGA